MSRYDLVYEVAYDLTCDLPAGAVGQAVPVGFVEHPAAAGMRPPVNGQEGPIGQVRDRQMRDSTC
ncbi:hypothetical protein ACFVW5_15800 [Streptomyces sp. NPDC058232]|uniref:hypothetical protein n=1 Tax=Streptomyces sp. NPDC058232 TaxID=3346393 RepID=UPI0036E38B9A